MTRTTLLTACLLALGCGRDLTVGQDLDDAGPAGPDLAAGGDAASSRDAGSLGDPTDAPAMPPDGAGGARDAAHEPADAPVAPADAAAPVEDAAAPPPDAATAPPDAALPPPDAAAPADCRALVGSAGQICDPATFQACGLPFGAGCCTHQIFCDAGRVVEAMDCDDSCDQGCHANPTPDDCGLQFGCTWFVGGCDPPPEGFVAGPACIPTPSGGPCQDDAECPAGERCLRYWIDPCADGDCDACGGEARMCGQPPGPWAVDDVCRDAAGQVAACFPQAVPPERYGLGWPECGPFERCAAECMQGLDCGGIQCSFDASIDCDGEDGWMQCFHGCAELACPEDCGLSTPEWDCCAERWSCGGGCDMDCVIPEPPVEQVCRCREGQCQAVPSPR